MHYALLVSRTVVTNGGWCYTGDAGRQVQPRKVLNSHDMFQDIPGIALRV